MEAEIEPWIHNPGEPGWTTDDLHALPDDGLRYELIDGSFYVSPSATSRHSVIARWIANQIEASGPSEGWFVSTDQSVLVDKRSEPRPDIVVAPARHLDETPFPISGAVLVAEVVSPTSTLRDLHLKQALYARAGVPAYWIIQTGLDSGKISLAELRLDGRQYQWTTGFTTDSFTTDHPWAMTIDLPALSARYAKVVGND